MTAIFYAALVLGAGAVYAFLAWRAIADGAPTWWFVVGVPFVYVALALVLILGWFSVSHLWRGRIPADSRLGFPRYVTMLGRELLTVVTSWPAMALNRFLVQDPVGATDKVPVLLIHGVWNNDGVWLRFRRYLARRDIGPTYTINCGPPMADIEHFADQVAQRIDAICGRTGASRVILVGHSMGGLIARAYLRRYGPKRVAKVITVGTPHHGSMLAWAAVGRCLEQMRPGNAWLSALNRTAKPHPVPVVSIWSHHDTMVIPQTNSELCGAKNVPLVGIAHNALLRDRRVYDTVAAEILGAQTDTN